ncbi:MAG: aspartate/glutamate racemase family protein, partial [Elusimicrobiota bacterium]|nr:aspartate/glutamate racemase family protein [Elusimicrobiota bacterium]
KAAYQISKNKKIGIIGTKGTIKSNAYKKALQKIDNSLQIFSKACPLFVPLVEENWINKKETRMIAKSYLDEFKDYGIDTLILGCTHYPLLKNVISKVLGEKINIVDSAIETSKTVKNILYKNKKLELLYSKNKGIYKFFVSDDEKNFLDFGKKILNKNIVNIKKVKDAYLF